MSLTLPGTIPGLLRRCSPVLDPINNRTGLVMGVPAGTARVCMVAVDSPAIVTGYHAEQLHLDLSDATGRTHACWWLSEKLGSDERTSPFAVWQYDIGPEDPDGGMMFLFGAQDVAPSETTAEWIDLIDDMDCRESNTRTLEDGSRWIDVEALRRICLHVAGVSP